MNVLPEEVLGNVVGRNFYASEIFDSYDINYCCEGGLSIAEACKNQNIDIDIIIKALEELPDQEDVASSAFCDWSLDLLAEYIEKKHHRYVDHNLPELKDLLDEFIAVPGNYTPELKELRKQLNQFEADLIIHIQKEELNIIPYIKQLVLLDIQQEKNKTLTFSCALKRCVENSLKEHEDEGIKFDEINTQMKRLIYSDNLAGLGYLILRRAREFERDLHRHIHLENNILFPKAIEIQLRLIKKYNDN